MKVPSERALFRQYGVSRATATKALATLEHDTLPPRQVLFASELIPRASTLSCAHGTA